LRVLVYLLLILVLASLVLSMVVVLGWIESFISSSWSELGKSLPSDVVNASEQLVEAMSGGKEMVYRGVEVGLLIAFLALAVAVFAYSRRR